MGEGEGSEVSGGTQFQAKVIATYMIGRFASSDVAQSVRRFSLPCFQPGVDGTPDPDCGPFHPSIASLVCPLVLLGWRGVVVHAEARRGQVDVETEPYHL